ncbi:XRE family transcriptional regulator [Sesbania bispinosa]|nr:XRE family transcriptional regulator [Sesbania bispinosa]
MPTLQVPPQHLATICGWFFIFPAFWCDSVLTTDAVEFGPSLSTLTDSKGEGLG